MSPLVSWLVIVWLLLMAFYIGFVYIGSGRRS